MSVFSPSIPPTFNEEESDGPNPTAMMMNKFLETRTVLIFGGVDQKMAERVTTQILYLDHVSHDPIRLMINSPGGHVESGDTLPRSSVSACPIPVFLSISHPVALAARLPILPSRLKKSSKCANGLPIKLPKQPDSHWNAS